MAMTTFMQMVSDDEIAALRANPSSINELDQPDDQSTFTQLQPTLCYFCCGTSYPDGSDGPLAAALAGDESVAATTLENGVFHIVNPTQVKAAAAAWVEFGPSQLRSAIEAADDMWELVEEEELYDLEPWLADGEDIAAVLVDELESIRAFYESAAEKGLGVVMYTT